MQNSSIEWTDHTFNPWWGCIKVSPGCEHCYAETLAKRYGHAVWGTAKTTSRRMMSENYWRQPIKWDRLAEVSGRKRVFCASMADVFEDHPQVVEARARLFGLISQTPNLDWLLLTKRPENFHAMLPADWRGEPPANLWLGTSVENQEQAERRIPYLLDWPSKVRFLSCEPLLGTVDISGWLKFGEFTPYGPRPLHWVICGGESGPGARPMHPDWARSLRDQCEAAGVAFHFKQWGEHAPVNGDTPMPCGNAHQLMRGVRRDGSTLTANDTIDQASTWMWRAGKHRSGRLLDGREWNELPQ